MFPAYSKDPPIRKDFDTLSFPSVSNVFKINEDPSSPLAKSPENYILIDSTEKRKKKKKSSKKSKHKSKFSEDKKDEVKIPESSDYYIDTRSEKGYLRIHSLSRNHIAIYHKYKIKELSFGLTRSHYQKRKQNNRYYKCYFNPKEEKNVQEDDINDVSKNKKTSKKIKHSESCAENQLDNCLKDEEELSKITENFNKILYKEPNNIDKWLEFIKFQDTISQFEKTYKASGSKSHHATTVRKLSILDKALELNPESTRLLRKRYFLSDEIYSADHIANELEKLIIKRPLNLILWKNLLDVKQNSVGQCTTSSVLKTYDKAMTALHKARKGAALSTIIETEDKIIQLLYQCGLFLRQAGLWEQLWTILRMYLELNIIDSNNKHFNISVPIDEEKLRKHEDDILASRLPLAEIWYRTERLREGIHWLPITTETEDPQRVVFNEDVSMLLHPITSNSLSFKLITMIISLFKVPLLPMRHTATHHLGILQPLSSMDSIELFLATSFPNIGLVSWNCNKFFTNILELVSGAQYLDSSKLGQEEYLTFIKQLIESCAACLQDKERTALLLWWLRFERFLYTLQRSNIIQIPSLKKLNKKFKEFLILEPNRNVILFYREYALFEAEIGKTESAIKILLTSIQSQTNSNVVLNRQSDLCHLYRTLCQLLIGQNQQEQAISILMSLVLGQKPNLMKKYSNHEIIQGKNKFHHITTEILSDIEQYNENELELKPIDHFLPNFETEWLSCHAWFLFLTENYLAASEFLKNILNQNLIKNLHNDEQTWTWIHYRQELLYETLISIVHWNCHNTYGSYGELEIVLQEVLALFPDNGYFLSTLANIETTSGCIARPWWQLSRYFNKTDSSLAKLFILFLIRQRKMQLDEALMESYKTLNLGGPVITDKSQSNRIAAMLSSLIKNPITRRCPLFWRVYIQFLFYNDKTQDCDKAFCLAIDQCPWVKAFYLDGARFAPSKLEQIQDILIEKELRLHITPEELDILRDGNEKEFTSIPTTSNKEYPKTNIEKEITKKIEQN